jgi:hypothetical protein
MDLSEEVLAAIGNRLAASAAKAEASRKAKVVSPENIRDAIERRDWAKLILLTRDLTVFFPLDYDARQDPYTEEILGAIKDAEPTKDLVRFIKRYFDYADLPLTPEIISVIFDKRFEDAGFAVDITYNHNKVDHAKAIEYLAVALDTQSFGGQTFAKEVLKNLFGFFPKPTNQELNSFADRIFATGRDDLAYAFVTHFNFIDDEHECVISADQFARLLKQGLNATIGFVITEGIYQPTHDDLRIAIDTAEVVADLRGQEGGPFWTDDNSISVIISSLDQITLDDVQYLLEAFEKTPTQKLREAVYAALQKLPSAANIPEREVEKIVKAVKNLGDEFMFSYLIENGWYRPTPQDVSDYFRDGNDYGLFALCKRGELHVTPEQFDFILEQGSTKSWSLIANKLIDQGYEPTSAEQIDKLLNDALGKLVARLKQQGVDPLDHATAGPALAIDPAHRG